jgi:hypothetical protein
MIHSREAAVDDKRMTAITTWNCCRLGGSGKLNNFLYSPINSIREKSEMWKITMNGVKDWNWT